jgi:hypothetical protein
MAGQNLDLSQFDDLAKFIEDLGDLDHYANPLLRRATNMGAEIVREDVEWRIPRSKINKEHLQDNIIVRPASVTKDGRVVAKIGFPGYSMSGRKGFYYANPLQKGHIVRTKKGYKLVRAFPALEPAWESKKGEAMDEMYSVLRDGMADVLMRVAKRRAKSVRKE